MNQPNVDSGEIAKFNALAERWWDPNSEFRPLHDINPLRLNYIDERLGLPGKKVIDIGCGGGLLSEGMARRGATVTGIDLGEAPLAVARLHAEQSGVEVEYLQVLAEDIAEQRAGEYDAAPSRVTPSTSSAGLPIMKSTWTRLRLTRSLSRGSSTGWS